MNLEFWLPLCDNGFTMRKRILEIAVLLVLVALAVSFYPGREDESLLIGRWQAQIPVAVPSPQTVVMEFRPDNTFSVEVAEEKHVGSYQAYSTGNEISHLNLNVEGEEQVLTIFKFQDDGTLLISDSNPGKPRPEDFSDALPEFHRLK